MIFPPPTELKFFGVFNSGVPNQERLVFQVTERVNLAQFGIFVCLRNANGTASPILDNLFWFGEMHVSPPTWIVVMTCPGVYESTFHPNTKEPMQVFFWGRKKTVFENSNIVPVVFQMSSVLIGNRNENLQQPKLLA